MASRPRPAAAAPAAEARATRAVVCTWCNERTQVAPSAKSVVCPHCNKRLVIEDFRTASYHAVRQLATCGDVVVEKKGHVVAAVRAANVLVEGKLTGNVTASGTVTVGKAAVLKGDIVAPRLRVEGGAVVAGFLQIGVEPA